MFQKNLKLRTNIVVGTVPLQNYETPQKTVDVTEAFSFYPPCAMATEEYANDTPPLKNREREETAKPSLSCTYRRVTQYIYIYMYIYIYTYIYSRYMLITGICGNYQSTTGLHYSPVFESVNIPGQLETAPPCYPPCLS